MELRPLKVFQVTGLSLVDRENIGQQIEDLGGTYIDSEAYIPSCTHLICGKPSRSEKYLAACATGRWVLQPRYIKDSLEMKQWLSEEEYEWSASALKASGLPYDDLLPAVQAVRRWRLNWSRSGLGAFAGWRVAVVVSNATKKQVYRRLLKIGGATVHNLSLPLSSCNKQVSSLTHIFVDRENAPGAAVEGAWCLRPEYIGEFLFKDPPPDPHNFSVEVNQRPDPTKFSVVAGPDHQPEEKTPSGTSRVDCHSFQITGTPRVQQAESANVQQLNPVSKNCDLVEKSPLKATSSHKVQSKAGIRDGPKVKQSRKTSAISFKGEESKTTPKVKQSSIMSFLVPSPKPKDQKPQCSGSNDALTGSSVEKPGNSSNCASTGKYPKLKVLNERSPSKASPVYQRSMLRGQRKPTHDLLKDLDKQDVSKSTETATDWNAGKTSGTVSPLRTRSRTADKLLPPGVSCCQPEHSDLVSSAQVRNTPESVAASDYDCSQNSDTSVGSLQPRVKLQRLEMDTDSLPFSLTTYSDHTQSSQGGSNNRKRKLGGEENMEKENITGKRKKLPGTGSMWRPRNADFLTSLKDKNGMLLTEERSHPLTRTVTGLFETGLEEGMMVMAVNSLMSLVSRQRYPQSSTLYQLMNNILMVSTDEVTMYRAYNALRRISTCHPPTTPALRTVYLHALHKDGVCNKENTAAEWEFIRGILEQLIQSPEEREEAPSLHPLHHTRCLLLLQYLVTLLEQDFQHMMLRTRNSSLNKQAPSCMLGKILWPSGPPGTLNTYCKELLAYLTSIAASKDITNKNTAVHLVQSLITMAAAYTQLLERVKTKETSNIGDRAVHFAREVALKIMTENFEDVSSYELVLNNLKPSWLCMKVCEHILDLHDESLLPLNCYQGEPLSLRKIVSRYFYVLPVLEDKSLISPHKKLKSLNSTPLKDLGDPNQGSISTQARRPPRGTVNHWSPAEKRRISQVNKRNPRGETPLHVACIKNNVAKVKELLATPGVDVNAADYAGWTPLHEACNHGHIDCVMELLKYKPQKTMYSYFDNNNCHKESGVDLRVCNVDGITPLHDAVQNNHLEVARVLLNYGGASLLSLATKDGSVALDYACTEEMKSLLKTPITGPLPGHNSARRRLYSTACAQSSQDWSQTEEASTRFLPDAEVYAEVLGVEPHRNHASREECHKLVLLLYNMLKTYISHNSLKLRRVAAQGPRDNSQIVLDNSQASQELELLEDWTENLSNNRNSHFDENGGARLRDDLDIVRDLRCHVRDFEVHVNILYGGEIPVSVRAKISAMKFLGP
ncbi:SMC5-SMC6 complex localization factor protein 1 [Lingula anatina]|uniref:SMC5-SMC6 complex localization factor protein 1 n=1 Tax=Lingula anatina TaxID=7574 RepID=A0A1S3J075_LINAN|nr:SMC5-SMC6 complex localization factor protein 1 [Lingula anatina]|eukprot:XP_013403658.1 SMC5-SMC6 complex localization factor protein 1 [Lingula anatina]